MHQEKIICCLLQQNLVSNGKIAIISVGSTIFLFFKCELQNQINCNDDDGVLYGRWDGKYGDGKKPTSWKGSVKILKEWNDTGMTEVKYGQCWVFSGVLTTGIYCYVI